MVTVREARQRSRFEVLVDDEVVGFLVYHEEGGRVAFPHTEVDPRHQGHGLAGRLAATALDAARQREQQVLPYCRFVAGFIAQHPQYADLVPPAERAAFGLTMVPE
ncbi:MAG TPA: GNAT family N-acetyltransferase [Nocardioidaceae bacterium]|jgi:predicted GNAT family acetyltransferase|nr:GNAT family N-acetyltransferase [Nocardioidaceae bacterium]